MQSSVAEKTYQHLRRKLANGELASGDRLITRTIAKEVGSSLGPVREAISRLANEGLVNHTPGAGASVWVPDRRDLEELYVLREANESYAAREAAKFIAEEEIEAMDAILEDWVAITNQIREHPQQHATPALANRWFDNEAHFHQVLVDASRNRKLIKLIQDSRVLSGVFDTQRQTPEILTLQNAEDSCRGHERLIQSLRDRNPELARQLMSEQIQSGWKTTLSFFSSNWRQKN